MISVPLITPLRFKLYGYSDNFNTKYFDLHHYPQTLTKYDTEVPYIKPFQITDPLAHYFISSNNYVTVNYYNCNGEQVFSESPSELFHFTLPDDPLFAYSVFAWETDLNDLGEGKFYVRYNDGSTTVQSETFEVFDSCPDTVLIQYRHNKTYQSVVFEKLADDFYFYVRVQGYIRHNLPERVSTTYEDQILNMTALRNVPYNSWSYITDSAGISTEMIDLLNRVFGCFTLSIDGRLFTIPQDAKWEEKEEEFYPLRGWGIDMREKIIKTAFSSEEITSGGFDPPVTSKKELFSDWWVTTPGQYKLTGSATSAINGYRIDEIGEIKECDRDGKQYDPDTTPVDRQYYHNTGTDEVVFDSNIPFTTDPDGNPETVFILFTKK